MTWNVIALILVEIGLGICILTGVIGLWQSDRAKTKSISELVKMNKKLVDAFVAHGSHKPCSDSYENRKFRAKDETQTKERAQ